MTAVDMPFLRLVSETVTPCKTMDSRMWFADPDDAEEPFNNPQVAVGYCHDCPIMLQCAEHAITNKSITHGVWGGLTMLDIRRLRRKRNLAKVQQG